jgi:hypothetical protein
MRPRSFAGRASQHAKTSSQQPRSLDRSRLTRCSLDRCGLDRLAQRISRGRGGERVAVKVLRVTEASNDALDRKWQSVLADVRRILMRDWHPVGAAVPNDEYDSYALTITGMLLRQCSAREVADYLVLAEAHILGTAPRSSEARARTETALMNLCAPTG